MVHRRAWSLQLAALGASCLIVVACTDSASTGPEAPGSYDPWFAISDASHEVAGIESNPHFHLLPPLVHPQSVSFNGPADLSLDVEIEICLAVDLKSDGRCSDLIQSFSRTPTGDEGVIRVKPHLEMYLALWDARALIDRGDVGELYRANFFVGDEVLGFADVEVARSLFGVVKTIYAQTKTIEGDDDFAAIAAGLSILPLPFRIEEGALAPAVPPTTVFVNFDGVTLQRSTSTDDATTNTSALVQSAVAVVPAFSAADLGDDGGLTRDQVIAETLTRLETIHAPYNVAFTTSRPSSGDYSMLVIGGSCVSVVGMAGCEGIAVADCGNVMPNNIGFVFPGGLRVEDLAVVAARQNAIALGVETTDNPLDIMYPGIQVTPPTAFTTGNIIGGACGAPGTFQNSHQAMLDVLGAA